MQERKQIISSSHGHVSSKRGARKTQTRQHFCGSYHASCSKAKPKRKHAVQQHRYRVTNPPVELKSGEVSPSDVIERHHLAGMSWDSAMLKSPLRNILLHRFRLLLIFPQPRRQLPNPHPHPRIIRHRIRQRLIQLLRISPHVPPIMSPILRRPIPLRRPIQPTHRLNHRTHTPHIARRPKRRRFGRRPVAVEAGELAGEQLDEVAAAKIAENDMRVALLG